MAGNFQTYALVSAAIDGASLQEEIKLSIKRENGAQLIKTVLKGFAGLSPGAPMIVGTIDNALPGAGLEYNAGPKIVGCIPVSLKFVQIQNGKGLVFPAYFMDDTTAHGVGIAASYDLAFVGAWTDWA